MRATSSRGSGAEKGIGLTRPCPGKITPSTSISGRRTWSSRCVRPEATAAGRAPDRGERTGAPATPRPKAVIEVWESAESRRRGQATWQLQVGPHAQAGPHRQGARGAAGVFWQPHVQDGPGHAMQGQAFD
jgi:hypothetical protein